MLPLFALSVNCNAAVILKSDEFSGGQAAKFPVYLSFLYKNYPLISYPRLYSDPNSNLVI